MAEARSERRINKCCPWNILDEVMAGLNKNETMEMIDTVRIRKIHAQGMTIVIFEHVMRVIRELTHRVEEIKKDVTILVTEQNVRQALKAIDRGYILEDGKISMANTAQNLAGNDHIRKSYLGI